MAAFVVDAKVLVAIRKANGLRVEQRTNELTHTINMNKRTLQDFVKDPRETFKHFKLRGTGILNQSIRMKFRDLATEFDLTFILPSKKLSQVIQLNLDFSEVLEVSE